MNFILIDGSYYVFYRYHAIRMWWSKAFSDAPEKVPEESIEFMNKFTDTFSNKLFEIEKKNKIISPIRIVAKDCPRKNIWRTKIYPEYKATRNKESRVGMFMKKAYADLFVNPFTHAVIHDPALEADDCIAITTKHILDTYPDCHIWIITSDTDYLQLANKNITIMDLKGRILTDSKKCTGDCKIDLLCKIIGGDTSDNIPSVFTRCGAKTAYKYATNDVLLQKKLSESKDARDAFTRNSLLIDFNNIPTEIVTSFKETCLKNKKF